MKQKGFSLVEVLISLFIAITSGILLMVIIVNSIGLFYSQSSKLEQGVGVNEVLSKVKETVREASSIAVSYSSYTTSATQLVLKIPAINSLGDIIPSTFDHFIFHKDQDKLRFKVFPDSLSSRKTQDQILSSNVLNLLFQYYNSQVPPQEVLPSSAVKVRITLTLKQKSGASFEQTIATSEASLRND